MFKNYLKASFRNIMGHKLLSLINILGLAIGLACCLAISIFVYQELTYDAHYRNADRVYRVDRLIDDSISISSSYLLAPLLKQDIAEIEEVSRVSVRNTMLTGNGRDYSSHNVSYVDSTFFSIFDMQWLAGDPGQALENPDAIVITQSLATRLFGSENPMGETVLSREGRPMQVSGVIADLLPNTQLRAQAFISVEMLAAIYANGGAEVNAWNFNPVTTFIMLDQTENLDVVKAQFPDFVERHISGNSNRITGLSAMGLTDIRMNDPSRSILSNMTRVVIFSSIALCILVIAIINFINLSTARSTWRTQEIGVRKSLGASRSEIVRQFLVESIIMSAIAMMLALGIVEIFLPMINSVIGEELTLTYFVNPEMLASLLLFTFVVGIAAGYYPAITLSGSPLTEILRGDHAHGFSGIMIRNGLVIFQFIISITLIVCSAVVFLQMKLTRDIDLGFNQEQIVTFQLPASETFDVNSVWDGFKARLLDNPGIVSATHAISTPLQPSTLGTELRREGRTAEGEFIMMWIEPDFFLTYQVDFLAGRSFSTSLATDYSRLDLANPGILQGSIILGLHRLKWVV